MRTSKNVYRRFIEFEEHAAEIYLGLASRFGPENRELGSLWLDMGLQEKEHAGILQFCLAEGMFVTPLPTESQIRQFRGLFVGLKKRAAAQKLTIVDAFEIAIEMEVCEVNTIYSHLTSPMHRSLYLLKRKILTSMPDHLERLLIEARKFSVPVRILKKLERVVLKTA